MMAEITEKQRLDAMPWLVPIVETIRLHAGSGYFFGGMSDSDRWGWWWDSASDEGPQTAVHLDSDGMGSPVTLLSFDFDGDDGPAGDDDGCEPSIALADACGRWLAGKVGLVNSR